ncbi:hypothetical protein P4U99_21600 [Brevibacillus agri]|nr:MULTISPECIES: hypothetical protein [Brevibacillus]MDN4093973.1 hypothetical protein [Brevibacillus agri]MDR9504314.1 hypothetical protein [Brevibacillus agri]MED1645746.1 hypothetical protein [Brevibacillus agri]MED1655924.1 hypothetical protein [Brevibacillus agri]MED1689816.1 hypothetical protein [Brevibacillus agri]
MDREDRRAVEKSQVARRRQEAAEPVFLPFLAGKSRRAARQMAQKRVS